MDYALRWLGYRARSVAEMRQRLERRGCAPQVTERTLAALTRVGLLDDLEFARSWVVSHPGRGPVRLKRELWQKGIDRELAEEIVCEQLPAAAELASAWRVAQRALRSQGGPPDRAELLRVRRLLQRRGFSVAAVGRTCARLSDQVSVEGDWLE